MPEDKTPDPNSQPLKVEDILAKAEEIRNARDRQSSVTNSDLGEAFKLFTVVDEESKLLTNTKESFKVVRIFWNWTGFGEKKLWDIIQILFVPVALAVAGFWFQGFTKDQEVKLADSKIKQELKVADDKAKQETLTKYLDQMSDLLQKGLLKSKQDSPIFIISQSKTVIALQSLDPVRQHLVVQFLESANLNGLDGGKGLLYRAKLSKAQLEKADLSGANFKEADFSGAQLKGANLSGADLSGTNLSEANLHGVNLSRTNLQGTLLVESNFKEAYFFHTKLQGANIIGADFRRVNLKGNHVTGTEFAIGAVDFSEVLMLAADFSGANLSQEQLRKSDSLFICGSSLPEKIKIDNNRDCAVIPQILMKRYPKTYKTLKETEDFINSDRPNTWNEDENNSTEK
jgi:uncharacterized protein YjbI with pentapeptide repeats